MGEREGRIKGLLKICSQWVISNTNMKNTMLLTKIDVDYEKGTFQFDDKKESLIRKNLV